MKGTKLFAIALFVAAVSAAFAGGWTVNVTTSQGTLFNGGPVTVNVPFIINGFYFTSAPVTQSVSTLPQLTFLTNTSSPPILVGNGTSYRGGTFTAAYTITSTKPPLTGFNFVVRGSVFGLGRVTWTKKVVDINTSDILYDAGGVFSGASYPGGSDGIFQISTFVPLTTPSSNVLVIETFTVDVNGAQVPGTDTASLLLVEQDWVPEPASVLVLSAGLAGLLLRRRTKK